MKILAVIPARKGSKGIKRKNHLKINRKSLVEISIIEAEKSKMIDRLIFSSDDEELINKIKKKKFRKVEVPFLRPKKLATDKASSYSVLKHAYLWLKNKEKWNADILILLQPTTPFRTSKIIDKAIRLLIKNKKSDALMTITDADYPPYWMFKKRKTRLFPILKGHKFSRRQDAPKVFKPAGLVYALRTKYFLKYGKIDIQSKKTLGYYVKPDFSLNIDNYNQYLLSKIKYMKKKFIL